MLLVQGCNKSRKYDRDQPLYAVGVMGGGMGRSAFSPIIADSVARRSAQGVAGG